MGEDSEKGLRVDLEDPMWSKINHATGQSPVKRLMAQRSEFMGEDQGKTQRTESLEDSVQWKINHVAGQSPEHLMAPKALKADACPRGALRTGCQFQGSGCLGEDSENGVARGSSAVEINHITGQCPVKRLVAPKALKVPVHRRSPRVISPSAEGDRSRIQCGRTLIVSLSRETPCGPDCPERTCISSCPRPDQMRCIRI
ncbi:hypothetical protein B0H10DRAFT_699172 [Mycena sp. CBHHK59/15]|nr:hypothetical protein B0H10DRAFT_699172 [Mycena sp. CBHHK59/15]